MFHLDLLRAHLTYLEWLQNQVLLPRPLSVFINPSLAYAMPAMHTTSKRNKI